MSIFGVKGNFDKREEEADGKVCTFPSVTKPTIGLEINHSVLFQAFGGLALVEGYVRATQTSRLCSQLNTQRRQLLSLNQGQGARDDLAI